jgi:hypothetical protein
MAIPQPTRLPQAAYDLVQSASRSITEASVAEAITQRYAHAYIAALRAAAAVLAARARPTRGRPRSVWLLLPKVAPDLTEWAIFFSSCSAKRIAAEAGSRTAVSARDADDLLRDANSFLALVADQLGVHYQAPLHPVGV